MSSTGAAGCMPLKHSISIIESIPPMVLLQDLLYHEVAAFAQPYLIVKLFQFDVSDFFKMRDFSENEFETNLLQTFL